MSPPLVVAFAMAGTVSNDLTTEPLGTGKDGPVYLRDIWPTSQEMAALLSYARDPPVFRKLYSDFGKPTRCGTTSPAPPARSTTGRNRPTSKPPFFDDFSMHPAPIGEIVKARALGIFGDSVTTDHISPAGIFKKKSPAGAYLLKRTCRSRFQQLRRAPRQRPGHDPRHVRQCPHQEPHGAGERVEGGVTQFQPSGEKMPIYDAAMKYIAEGTPTVVIGGEEYGTGSSRDWAAKGTQLLGVKAVIAKSFERIHRTNLVGMGVLPLQFKGSDSVATLGIAGDELFSIVGTQATSSRSRILCW